MTYTGQRQFHRIGEDSDVVERGMALVFDIDKENFIRGFVVRFNNNLYCYRNHCPHAGSELDWVGGQFFDDSGELLICATHGAKFNPETGKCVSGPCLNQSLTSVPVKLESAVIMAWF
jgi:nitrite reductase/ring-hydroxylating ferredoxin subunit